MEAATWKRRQLNPSLTLDEARKPEHGSVIHAWLENHQGSSSVIPASRMNTSSQLHYDTAMRFMEVRSAWLAAIAAQRPRSSSDFDGPGGYDGSDPFEKGRAVRNRAAEAAFKDARRVILEAGAFCMMAVEAIVIENQPAERLRGDLRLALNRLASLWKMQQAA